MASVFKTAQDTHDDVVVVGVGVLPAGGRGGIPVDRAAALGLAELQKKDAADGTLALKDGEPVPLTGSALAAAAQAWAAGVPGVEIVQVKEADLAGLRYEDGTPVPAYPSAGDKAAQEAAATEVVAPAAAPPEATATGAAAADTGGNA